MRHLILLAALVAALPAAAEDIEPEITDAGDAVVRFYPHKFLSKDEVTTLRLVATNAEARALFVPSGEGFAALAVAPKEGLVRKGAPSPSAVAVAGLPDAATAAVQAIMGCNAAKKRGPDCVVVLEVAVK